MRTVFQALDRGVDNIRWAARVSGLEVAGIFLLLLILAFTNEDGVPARAVAKLILRGV